MKTSLVLSVLDQGLLSVFSFAVGLLLIKTWSQAPEMFGIYSIIMAVSLVTSTLQNALVAVHLSVMRPRATDETELSLLGMFWFVNCTLIVGATLATALGAGWVWGQRDPMLALGASAYIGTFLLRDYIRIYYFAEMNVAQVLLTDLVYVTVSIAVLGIYLVASKSPLRVSTLCLLLAGSSVLGAFPALVSRRPHFTLPAWHNVMGQYGTLWREHARWALLGAVTTEIQNRGYVFVVGAFFGAAAVGLLQAANLLFRPLGMLVQAWGRIARPWFAGRYAAGETDRAQHFAHWSAIALLGVTALFTILLMMAWPWIERFVLHGAFNKAQSIVVLWGIATAVTVVPAVYSMQAQGLEKFRDLSTASIVGALTSAVTLAIVVLSGDFAWSVMAIALGQIASLVAILTILVRALGRSALLSGLAGMSEKTLVDAGSSKGIAELAREPKKIKPVAES